MKKNTNIIMSVICLIAILLSVSLTSCGQISEAEIKGKILEVKSMAEQNKQWMPAQCSGVVYTSSHPDASNENIQIDIKSVVAVAPTYAWYQKSVIISDSTNDEDASETAGFVSIMLYDGKIYGAVEHGSQEEVGTKDLIQYEIIGAKAESFVTCVQNLTQEYNKKVNDTIKKLLVKNKPVQEVYDSGKEYATTSSSGLDSIEKDGTLYTVDMIYEDAEIGGIYVGIQNDNDDIYEIATSERDLHNKEIVILRGYNGFEKSLTKPGDNLELSEITLEEFLKKTEILLSDSEISGVVQSITDKT